ncbi:hypothetical protein STAS_23022 [Striga asiatica]|uniref:Uncharacterized protein n=1 Tax=Striga asiatica TaxID=4170 RepID=A0A5A7QM16_STRAF|nr:hypothetical protein STAS_23022 [Striga asiatica]
MPPPSANRPDLESLLEASAPSDLVFSSWVSLADASACPDDFCVLCYAAAFAVVVALDGFGPTGFLKFSNLILLPKSNLHIEFKIIRIGMNLACLRPHHRTTSTLSPPTLPPTATPSDGFWLLRQPRSVHACYVIVHTRRKRPPYRPACQHPLTVVFIDPLHRSPESPPSALPPRLTTRLSSPAPPTSRRSSAAATTMNPPPATTPLASCSQASTAFNGSHARAFLHPSGHFIRPALDQPPLAVYSAMVGSYFTPKHIPFI